MRSAPTDREASQSPIRLRHRSRPQLPLPAYLASATLTANPAAKPRAAHCISRADLPKPISRSLRFQGGHQLVDQFVRYVLKEPLVSPMIRRVERNGRSRGTIPKTVYNHQ